MGDRGMIRLATVMALAYVSRGAGGGGRLAKGRMNKPGFARALREFARKNRRKA